MHHSLDLNRQEYSCDRGESGYPMSGSGKCCTFQIREHRQKPVRYPFLPQYDRQDHQPLA